ncbi:hypothetical protein AAZV13_20G025600 [Glycine max]
MGFLVEHEKFLSKRKIGGTKAALQNIWLGNEEIERGHGKMMMTALGLLTVLGVSRKRAREVVSTKVERNGGYKKWNRRRLEERGAREAKSQNEGHEIWKFKSP